MLTEVRLSPKWQARSPSVVSAKISCMYGKIERALRCLCLVVSAQEAIKSGHASRVHKPRAWRTLSTP